MSVSACQPPYTITPEILNRVAAIGEAIGRLTVLTDQARALRLRRINRIRTIHGSLAIEGNTLSEAQITAILDGKRVIAPPREVQEVKNALAAYDLFDSWKPETEKDLLEAHRILMSGLIDEADSFADGNGRMGRLWQSLILARWNPLFADIPVESLIFEHQAEYYQALQESTQKTDSAPFIAFMLRMILETVTTSAPQVSPQVTPQVRELLAAIQGEMGREALQAALGLSDRKSFRECYLKPALADGLIEMTTPDKPNSRLQKYRLTDKGRQPLAQNGDG
jgi:Fic family protein